MFYAKLVLVLLILTSSGYSILSADGKGSSKITPKDYPIIIGCINQYTHEILPAKSQTEVWACYYSSKGWKNLRFPSKKQYETMKKIYDTRAKMITAMTLMNHESQLDSNAKGCHKGGCDYGLFQIRDKNGGKGMTDEQQMKWFRDRKAWQLSSKGNCYQRVLEGNRENLLRCVFARHHGDLKGTAKYPSDRYEEWKFYNQLSF